MIEQLGFEDAIRNRVVEVDGVRLWLHLYPINNALGQRGFQRPPAPEEYDVARHQRTLASGRVIWVRAHKRGGSLSRTGSDQR